jgi:hypothetical protein
MKLKDYLSLQTKKNECEPKSHFQHIKSFRFDLHSNNNNKYKTWAWEFEECQYFLHLVNVLYPHQNVRNTRLCIRGNSPF